MKLNNGSWIIPSLNRPHRLAKFLETFAQAKCITPGLVLIDALDPSITEYLALPMPKNWAIMLTQGVSMGDKLRETWPLYRGLDWISLANDDHEIVTPYADFILFNQLTGKNFVTCSDNWNANGTTGKAAGATVFSGDLMRAIGYLFPPCLQHCFIDDIWEFIGRKTGCWTVDMSVVIEHRHVSKGEAPIDDTHKRMQEFFFTDAPIYREWRGSQATRVITSIRKLQDGQAFT